MILSHMDLFLSFIAIFLGIIILAVLWVILRNIVQIVINSILGLVVLFIANLFFQPPIGINLVTLLVCALGGIPGALILIVLRLLGVSL